MVKVLDPRGEAFEDEQLFTEYTFRPINYKKCQKPQTEGCYGDEPKLRHYTGPGQYPGAVAKLAIYQEAVCHTDGWIATLALTAASLLRQCKSTLVVHKGLLKSRITATFTIENHYFHLAFHCRMTLTYII